MTRYKYTDDQCQQIRAQYEAGQSTEELGKVWGAATRTIIRCIQRAGGQLRDAAALRAANKQRKLTPEQEQLAVQKSMDGMIPKAIAAELGVSVTTVKNSFRRQSYKPPGIAEAGRRARGMSDAQQDEAIRLRGLGWGCARIGKELGFNHNTIRRLLIKRGLMEPPKIRKPIWFNQALAMEEAGIPHGQIAAAVGVSPRILRKHFDAQGVERRSLRALTDTQEAEAEQLYLAGWTQQQIADRFGVDDATIGNILWRRGVEGRRPGDVLQKLSPSQQQEVVRLYRGGLNSYQLAAQFGASRGAILDTCHRLGVEIRDSDNPTDTIQHALAGTGRFEGADRECEMYVTDLPRHPGYSKLGISFKYEDRVKCSEGEYNPEAELRVFRINHIEAFFLEQAVADATRTHAEYPAALTGWSGATEVRRMEAADLAAVALRLMDQLDELGLWEFASRFVPMATDQRAICRLRAQTEVAA